MAPSHRRFRRLLVHLQATASTQPAFTRALREAQSSRVQLRLVDVLPHLPAPGGEAPAFLRLVREKMQDHLAEAVAEARRSGIATTSALLDGDEATALIQQAVAWRADVLLRSHAVHGAARHPAGPVDGQILRRCPCAVWLVTASQAAGERTIVAAVDPDPENPVKQELALRVSRTAMDVGAEHNATVHIVHAWTAYGHQVLASHASRKDLLTYYAACRAAADGRFEALRRDAGAPAQVRWHLIEGQNDRVLATFAEAKRASLVVLGTVGRTGLAGLVIGNTAERMLRLVRCSVLALKPAGFGDATPEGAGVRRT